MSSHSTSSSFSDASSPTNARRKRRRAVSAPSQRRRPKGLVFQWTWLALSLLAASTSGASALRGAPSLSLDSTISSSLSSEHLNDGSRQLISSITNETERVTELVILDPDTDDQQETISAEEPFNSTSTSTNTTSDTVVLSNSYIFQVLFGILLSLIVLFRLVMLCLLWRHRNHGTIQLAQPGVLGLLLIAGTIAIASSFFLVIIPIERVAQIFCLLRDPLTLTPLTLAGCILLGRVWRIVLLLTPVLQVPDEEPTGGAFLKQVLLKYLTFAADTYVHAAQGLRGCYSYLEESKQPYRYHREHQKRLRQSTIRRKIHLTQLLYLIFLLLLPQLVLQICNLIVPALKEQLHVDTSLKVTSSQDDIYNPTYEFTKVERWSCKTETGSWSTYLGVILMFLPYIGAAILALNASDDLPKVFDEAKAVLRSIKVLSLVIIVALPPLLWGGANTQPDSFVYLTSMLIFAIAMPPCWFIVYPKIWTAIQEDAPTRAAIRRLLLQRTEYSESATTFHSRHNNPHNNNDSKSRSAKLALTIAKLYEEQGQTAQSLVLFDDALAVWQVDPNRHNKEQIGGFTKDEIDSFNVADLECIVQLLIAKGRVYGTFNSTDKKGQKNAAQAWLDALEVYEMAPARANMTDRTMLFPVFSGLFVFLKGGKIEDDEKCSFEQNLAKKFVRETKLQGEPVHYTRALAMLCEVKARLGKFRVALEGFETLKKIYDPEEHSRGIAEAYGTDRSAQAFSQRALWHMQMRDFGLTMQACDFVLENILYYMDPTNILNMFELILPILRVFKLRDGYEKKTRDIFHKYVHLNHEKYYVKEGKKSPCTPLIKPMMTLLDICHDPDNFANFEDIVEWLIEEEGAVAPDFVDTIMTKLCWGCHSVTAELCLRVARRLVAQKGDASDTEALVLKGIDLCQKTEKKVQRADGSISLPVANEIHERVYTDLKGLAASLHIEYITDLDGHSSVAMSSKGSGLDLKNLPHSYRCRKRSSDGGSSSDRSPVLRVSAATFASGSRSNCSSLEGVLEEDPPHKKGPVSELSLDSKLRVDSCLDLSAPFGCSDPSVALDATDHGSTTSRVTFDIDTGTPRSGDMTTESTSDVEQSDGPLAF